MRDASGEVELLIACDQEGTLGNANCLPHFSNIICVDFLELLCM
jgi:hypothetical protein